MEQVKKLTNWVVMDRNDTQLAAQCSICLCYFHENEDDLYSGDEDMGEIVRLGDCADHYFHQDCIVRCAQAASADYTHVQCPSCGFVYGVRYGKQPPGGTMRVRTDKRALSGFAGVGTIVIDYSIPSGVQDNGVPFSGTTRTAYLPDNDAGRRVLKLLQVAFERRLTFMVGTSVTSGRENTCVWSGIHHKTQTYPNAPFGYPDATYLTRVVEELAAFGVTDADI